MSKGASEWENGTHFDIVFLEKTQDSLVVLKGHLLGKREVFKLWHISPARGEGLEDILGQTCRVEPEIGLEEKVDDVVDAPLA